MADRETYCVNLDPAVQQLIFPALLDICDTIKFKPLMQQYGLGPNGGIMTALNLYAAQFNQVMDILEAKENLEYIVVDTPGQIEVFSWSASGTIITECLASAFPTSIVYVVDSSRVTDPNSFMSNMLYACSIYYKTRLPLIVVFNKTDVAPCEQAKQWMTDFESFQDALSAASAESYLASLNISLSLLLDEFYSGLPAVGVSSFSGAGFSDLMAVLSASRAEFMATYYTELQAKQSASQAESIARLREDTDDLSQVHEFMAKLNVT
jgi:GTPase SAR1 family protein